jgi:hypothetical protein
VSADEVQKLSEFDENACNIRGSTRILRPSRRSWIHMKKRDRAKSLRGTPRDAIDFSLSLG